MCTRSHRPILLSLTLLLGTGAAVGIIGCSKDDDKEKKSSKKTDKKGEDDSDDDKVASCNMPKFKSCREYRGGNLALGTDMLKKLCADTGDFKGVACPTADLIGSCQVPEHKDIYYTGYIGGEAEEIKKACKANAGTFSKGK